MALEPSVTLTFNQPVDPDLVRKSLILVGQARGYAHPNSGLPPDLIDCSPPIAGVPDVFQYYTVPQPTVLDAWTSSRIPGSVQTFPRDFNAFILGDASGIPDAEGPIAIAGNLTLQNFNINVVAKKQIGLITGGVANLSNGTVAGDASYGAGSALNVVAVQGNTQAYPLDFAAASEQLRNMSLSFATRPATATTRIEPWGGVYLAGQDTKLNIFDVTASSLAQAPYIEVNVPTNAVALINVSGSTGIVGNCGISVLGTNKQHVLWNFVDATDITIQSVSFPGSLLAPLASVHLNSGNLEGNLVAASLSSNGSGELHYYPFVGFGGSSQPQTTVTISYPRLYAGCQYALSLPVVPLTGSGACLNKAQNIGFRVADGTQDYFTSETSNVEMDGTTPGLFDIRDGVSLSTQQMFSRYASTFRSWPCGRDDGRRR